MKSGPSEGGSEETPRTSRSRSPDTRRRAKQRASATRRELRALETREEYRSKLNEQDRAAFGKMSIARQERLLKIKREYPDSVPKDLPDPFSVLTVTLIGRCIIRREPASG